MADALAGLRAFPEAGHEARLRRLKDSAQPGRRVRPGRWAAAAAILLLAGAGLWLAQPSALSPAGSPIAGQPEQEKARSADRPNAPAGASTAADSVTVEVEEAPPATAPVPEPAPPAAPRPGQTAAEAPAVAVEERRAAKPEAEAEPPSSPLGYAAADTEAAQLETFARDDETANIRSAAPALSELSEAPANQPAYAKRSARAKAAPPATTANPAAGWPAFEAYLKEAWAVEDTTGRETGVDTFQVVFRISEDGRPVQIEVTASSAPRLNPEVKKLLRKGPLWQPGGAQAAPTLILPIE